MGVKNMEQSKKQINLTLIIVMITTFATPFLGNAINLAIPSIGKEFGGSQSQLTWVVSSYLIATAAFLLPFGRIADQFGRKKIFISGLVLLAASSLACAMAMSLDALVWFRIFQGIASAMIFGNATAILTSVVPPQSRGRALGLVTASTYVGLSAGPVLGGLITGLFSWRGIFYFLLVIVLIVIVITVWKLKGEWKGAAAKTDGWGILLCIAAQGLLLFGLTDLTEGWLYQASFAVGIVLLAVFFIYEKRHSNPLIPFDKIVRNRAFAFSNLASLINYSATFALSFIISLYLQSVLGVDTVAAGLVLLVQPIMMAVLSPFAGLLSDKIQPAILASLGMAISALGLFFFIFLDTQTPIFLIILNLAFIGIGFALFSSPNTNAIMSSVDRSLYGVASSIMNNMRLLGQSISMAIVAIVTSLLILDLSVGSMGYVDKLMASFRISFIIFTVLCVAGVVASLVRGNVSGGEE